MSENLELETTEEEQVEAIDDAADDTTAEEDSNVCAVCGSDRCPCATCHGDPKQYLEGKDNAIEVLGDDGQPTGDIQCPDCEAVS